MQIDIDLKKIENCLRCNSILIKTYDFIYENSPWLCIDLKNSLKNLKYNELPPIISIDNLNYQFLCVTTHSPGHFKAIFKLNSKDYLIDDLNPTMVEEKQPNEKLNVAFYFLI
jgi:hypothetical protein